ncbi:hypothetical protein [Streptosporangium carneum]|uniref:Uncharacterized protein n=1 Tax=Streptosporangium carneum TaxID=47481 RepID=A0A9W6MGB5_9ACTN|nr:hypothetical protein [Streptosporangium carneum]GLK13554.1 hypothetical protein GCM10017600_69650 [Streptosporangium carneum]
MGSLRSAAFALVGVSLVAACGGGRAATPSPSAFSSAPASPSVTRPDPTPGRAEPWSPALSPGATGEVPASAAWKVVDPARLSGSSALLDVAVTGPRDAWAVGFQGGAEDREGAPAVVRWDGVRWREVPAFTDRDVYHLVGVSAGGPADVWVVGNGENAFAAHWDGRRWTRHRPFGVAEGHLMTDVAVSGGGAWFTANTPSGAVLVEWRDGEFADVLDNAGGGGTFAAVTAKEGHVWAVGSSQERTPLVWHGRSGSWERMRPPAIPGGTLRRVWQVSPSDVWTVGEVSTGPDGPGDPNARPLVLHWDGARWKRVEVPVPRGSLHGVTAFGPGDLWISGVDADHAGQALFLHFDGTTWSKEYGPLFRAHREDQQYEETDDVRRTGVARVPGTAALWAVGSVGVGDDEDDFVLRR